MNIKVASPNFSKAFEDARKRSLDTMWARSRAWQNANKSDPFAYNTVVSHYKNGIAGPFVNGDGYLDSADYEVSFDVMRSPVTLNGVPLILKGEQVMRDHMVPRNMRRP